MIQQNTIVTNRYYFLFIIGLLLANFTTKTTYNHPIIWLTSTVLLIIYSVVFFINKKDTSYFIIFIIIGCHFTFGADLGGLFNILAFLILSIKVFTEKKIISYSINSLPRLLKIFLFVLVLSNFLSTLLFNTGTIPHQLAGLMSFFSCILVFLFSLNLTNRDVLMLLKVIVILGLFNFIAALNQRYFGWSLNTLLLPASNQSGDLLTGNSSGTIGSSALFGELYLLIFILLIFYRYLGVRQSTSNLRMIQFGIAVSLVNIILSNSRSVFILTIVSSMILLLIMIKERHFRPFLKLMFSLGILIIIGLSLGLFNNISDKMDRVEFQSLTLAGVFSGDEINRGVIFDYGLKRLTEKSWFLGQGFGVHGTNAFAWSGGFEPGLAPSTSKFADLHSLYIGLPMIFGWFGALCYVGTILLIIVRLFKSIKYQNKNYYGIVVGLVLLWIVFLINEYKVSVLALPHYQLLIWALLGFSSSYFLNANKRENALS